MAPAPPAAAPPSAAVERVQVAQSMPTETSAPVAVVSRVVSSSSLLLSNLSGALTSLTSAIVSGYAGAAAAALPPAAPPSTPLPTASPLAPTTPVDGEEAGLAPAHDSSSPQSDGSLFKPLHDPGLPELPLFVALREVRALLTAFIMTRRRGVLRSASDSMRWGWSPPSGSEYGSDGGGGDDGGSDKEDELLASLSSSRSGGGTGSEGLPPGGVRLMRDISATFAANAARGILLAEAEAAAAATVSGSRVADAACPEAHAGSGSASLPPRLPRADVARSRSVLALTVAEPRSGASFAELLRCPAYIAQLIDAVGEEAVGSTLRTPLSVHFIVQREVEASLYNVVSVRRAVASAVRNAVDGASAAAIIERQRRLRGVTRLQAHFGVPAALQAADGWAQAGLELRAANGLLCPREKMEALLASVRAIYRTHARAHAAAALASAAAAATAAAAPVDAAAPLRTCGGVAGASTCPCPAHAAAMHSSAHGERVAALAAGIPPITGDDLLQIFLCVLVRAQLEDPLTLCATLWATLDSTDLLSHCGYYLTALEASCAFLAPPAN